MRTIIFFIVLAFVDFSNKELPDYARAFFFIVFGFFLCMDLYELLRGLITNK